MSMADVSAAGPNQRATDKNYAIVFNAAGKGHCVLESPDTGISGQTAGSLSLGRFFPHPTDLALTKGASRIWQRLRKVYPGK